MTDTNETSPQRPMSRRQMLRTASQGALVMLLAACGSSPPQSTADTSEGAAAPATGGTSAVELTFLSHIFEPWNNALSDQVAAYTAANPQVRIDYSQVLHADLNAKIVTSIAGGTPSDIMGVYGPWMPQLIQGGAISPAPDWVLADLDANFPAIMKESATYDGQVYGYVQHIGIPTPIINLDLYEEAGVSPPSTYDELLAANEQLTIVDARGNPIQFGTTLSASKGGSWNVIHYGTILMAHGGSFLTADESAAAFDSDVGLQAAQIYRQLVHPEAPEDAFPLEKSAMIWTGPWQKGNLSQIAPNLRYQAILPLRGPAAQVTASYTWFWVVSSAAPPERQEAAWRFLQWISGPEQYEAVYNAVGLLPITNTLPASLAQDEWAQTFNGALEHAQLYYAKHARWEQIDLVIGEELERLAAREIDAEQFVASAASRVNTIL